jgi:hypothetical protein
MERRFQSGRSAQARSASIAVSQVPSAFTDNLLRSLFATPAMTDHPMAIAI